MHDKYKREFIDFSAGNVNFNDLAMIQQEGSVALYNILENSDESIAYLADEVGMGKTFIALGTVMLLRYLNPTLRVLFIAPNKQLKDQWIEEYKRFIMNHVKLSHGNIRSFNGESAVPYVNCNSLEEIIENTSSGYFADYFVQMNSFSFSLGENENNENNFYKEKLKILKKFVPAYTDGILNNNLKISDKNHVKQHYALALNYLLPQFDLIIVDEAHKFKNGVRTSARNKMLSLVLGTSGNSMTKEFPLTDKQRQIHKKLSKKVLLLSATPFDRDLNHIRNQIELFSGEHLANKYFPKNEKGDIEFSLKEKEKVKNTLNKFLVRRLNKIKIGNDEVTRNMYRKEHRNNAIELKGFEQKLIMALVQKHVGDLIENKQTSSPSFQMGLLASFESFSDSAGVKIFDGDDKINDKKDQAKDASLIQILNDSYKESGLGITMPHPKMDEVIKEHNDTDFANGEKHLFFVRRIKSVSELTKKWNEKYNEWLKKYLCNSKTKLNWIGLFSEYRAADPDKIISDQMKSKEIDLENEDIKSDTFFSWFFRGKNIGVASKINEVLYKDFKIKMTKKDDRFSLYFELNWFQFFNKKFDMSKNIESIQFKNAYLSYIKIYPISTSFFNRYHAAQYAGLFCIDDSEVEEVRKLLYGDMEIFNDFEDKNINYEIVRNDLDTKSLFNEMNELNEINIINEKDCVETFINKELLLAKLRQDHLMIDLYISLLRSDDINSDIFIEEFIKILDAQQAKRNDINSYSIIENTSKNISLICETSIQGFARDISNIAASGIVNSYNRNIHRLNLSPLDPIIGVTGETGNKSEPARKFRLPGYPIVMIATDVMQEGVNLHTFCRSITHYGLSGTPIHIEQKNGRVDRINSLTHRKIINNNYESLAKFDDDKIQVRFPFVKQSYESFQVRRLANNLNKYLISLHDIQEDESTDDRVFILDELSDNSPIPQAYEEFLKTPFEIKESQKKIPKVLFEKIIVNKKETEAIINLLSNHIKDLYEIDAKESLQSGKEIFIDNKKEIFLKLIPAKSNGEFLLEFNKKENAYVKKVELLVGSDTYVQENDHLTHKNEIIGAYERLFCEIDLSKKEKLDMAKINTIIGFWDSCKSIPFDRGGKITFEFISNFIEFKMPNIDRKHRVELYEIEVSNRKYILFLANIGVHESGLSEKIVDLVTFIKYKKNIVGFVLHDMEHIQPKEFMYCAYMLAIESDLYEYQLSLEDKH